MNANNKTVYGKRNYPISKRGPEIPKMIFQEVMYDIFYMGAYKEVQGSKIWHTQRLYNWIIDSNSLV